MSDTRCALIRVPFAQLAAYLHLPPGIEITAVEDGRATAFNRHVEPTVRIRLEGPNQALPLVMEGQPLVYMNLFDFQDPALHAFPRHS